MHDYHEILDIKYWREEKQKYRDPKTEEKLFKTIALAGLALVCWGLTEWISFGHWLLNSLALTFAIWAWLTAKDYKILLVKKI